MTGKAEMSETTSTDAARLALPGNPAMTSSRPSPSSDGPLIPAARDGSQNLMTPDPVAAHANFVLTASATEPTDRAPPETNDDIVHPDNNNTDDDDTAPRDPIRTTAQAPTTSNPIRPADTASCAEGPTRHASTPQAPLDAGVLPRSVSNSPTRSASQRIDDLLRKKREKDVKEMRGGGGGKGEEEEQFVRAAERPKG